MFRGPDPKSQHKKITHFSGHQKLEFHSNDQGWLQIMGLVIWKGLTFPSRISNQKCETMVINQLPSKHSTTCNLKMTWLFQKGIFQGVQFFWSSILNFKGMYSTIKPSNISNKLGVSHVKKKNSEMFIPIFGEGSLGHAASSTPLVPKLCHGLREVDKDTPGDGELGEVESQHNSLHN